MSKDVKTILITLAVLFTAFIAVNQYNVEMEAKRTNEIAMIRAKREQKREEQRQLQENHNHNLIENYKQNEDLARWLKEKK